MLLHLDLMLLLLLCHLLLCHLLLLLSNLIAYLLRQSSHVHLLLLRTGLYQEQEDDQLGAKHKAQVERKVANLPKAEQVGMDYSRQLEHRLELVDAAQDVVHEAIHSTTQQSRHLGTVKHILDQPTTS